jgi:hypothetical protein
MSALDGGAGSSLCGRDAGGRVETGGDRSLDSRRFSLFIVLIWVGVANPPVTALLPLSRGAKPYGCCTTPHLRGYLHRNQFTVYPSDEYTERTRTT